MNIMNKNHVHDLVAPYAYAYKYACTSLRFHYIMANLIMVILFRLIIRYASYVSYNKTNQKIKSVDKLVYNRQKKDEIYYRK